METRSRAVSWLTSPEISASLITRRSVQKVAMTDLQSVVVTIKDKNGH